MNQEEQAYMEQVQSQVASANAGTNATLGNANMQNAMVEQGELTMAQEQLDLGEEIERIEHLLRGHILKDGAWDKTIDPKCPPPLNEYGVRTIMKLVSFYLNKNKLLSNYDDETIREKMEDFSIELADLIFMKYREFGLDTDEKRKMYSVIVRELQDTIHDTYLRALMGKERTSIRQHWNMTENIQQQQPLQPKSLNPFTR